MDLSSISRVTYRTTAEGAAVLSAQVLGLLHGVTAGTAEGLRLSCRSLKSHLPLLKPQPKLTIKVTEDSEGNDVCVLEKRGSSPEVVSSRRELFEALNS